MNKGYNTKLTECGRRHFKFQFNKQWFECFNGFLYKWDNLVFHIPHTHTEHYTCTFLDVLEKGGGGGVKNYTVCIFISL